MEHLEARMRADGSIAVPSEIRQKLKLKEGDRIDFYFDANGRSVSLIARNGKLSDLKGLFQHSGPPLDIDEEIAKSIAEKHDRINREWAEWHAFQEWRKSRAQSAAE